MAIVLLTGMSVTGKSSALDELQRRGYSTVDTDLGAWVEEFAHRRAVGVERQWREDLMNALLAEHEISRDPLFVGGSVWNQAS